MDLTKITTPFGLLDQATKDALKEWPHGWEVYEGDWLEVSWPTWMSKLCYRARPAPPREFWISKQDARTATDKPPYYAPDEWIHVREVMDEARPLPNLEDA